MKSLLFTCLFSLSILGCGSLPEKLADKIPELTNEDVYKIFEIVFGEMQKRTFLKRKFESQDTYIGPRFDHWTDLDNSTDI